MDTWNIFLCNIKISKAGNLLIEWMDKRMNEWFKNFAFKLWLQISNLDEIINNKKKHIITNNFWYVYIWIYIYINRAKTKQYEEKEIFKLFHYISMRVEMYELIYMAILNNYGLFQQG